MTANAIYMERRYKTLRVLGVCVDCGAITAKPGRVRCARCLDAGVERVTRHRRPRQWRLRFFRAQGTP